MSKDLSFVNIAGGIFAFLGLFAFVAGIYKMIATGDILYNLMTVLAGVFVIFVGVALCYPSLKLASKRKTILKKGREYTGKIHSYVYDKTYFMDGNFLVNLMVRYFDPDGQKCEALVVTRADSKSNKFPLRSTIKIREYKGEFAYVPGSISHTKIEGEDNLMTGSAFAPGSYHLIAKSCSGCGASYTVASSKIRRCPYCGATN